MTYDDDLKIQRRVIIFGLVAQLGIAGTLLWAHLWLQGLSWVIWASNLVVWLRVLKTQQQTRDRVREIKDLELVNAAAFAEILTIVRGRD